MKELSVSVTIVDMELLHTVILYVTYSLYIKELGMAVTSVNIELHTIGIYEGVKYECNKCEYRDATQGYLIRYIKSVHGGAKYDYK